VNGVDGERAAVHFLRKKFDIFEQCAGLRCQHEQRVFSRRPLAGAESSFPESFSKYLNKINNISLNIHSQGTKGCFLNIFIIRAESQIQMTCLKFRSKTFNSNVIYFEYLG
jgi:hypothetical protein